MRCLSIFYDLHKYGEFPQNKLKEQLLLNIPEHIK